MLTLAQLDRRAPQIAALASALGVRERALRKAFKRSHNLSPCRHLRLLRLTWARQALFAAQDELATVTEIATSFGFVELGRFAVEYRNAFGESPSSTLGRVKSAKGPQVRDSSPRDRLDPPNTERVTQSVYSTYRAQRFICRHTCKLT